MDVHCLDELGFVPLPTREEDLLVEVILDRYEKCSTVLTANLELAD